MKRHFEPGRWNRDSRAVRTDTTRATTCCDGTCDQGRTCPLLPQRTPMVVRMPEPRIQLTGGRITRARRLRRFLRSLRDFLTAPRFL